MKGHGCHNKHLLYYRPSNSQGLTVRLTVWVVNSQSHDLTSKSHGEFENRKIARQFWQESHNLQLFWITCDFRCQKRFRISGFSLTSIKQLPWHLILVCQVNGCKKTSRSCTNLCFSGFGSSIGNLPFRSQLSFRQIEWLSRNFFRHVQIPGSRELFSKNQIPGSQKF